jgi:hypothetical protein
MTESSGAPVAKAQMLIRRLIEDHDPAALVRG